SNSATHVQSGTSMASPHVAGLMALLLSESPEENIPVRTLADMILKSVTKFSLNGQLVADTIATSANWPASSSDLLTDSERGKQPSIAEFHGKALARNLVYVGPAPVKRNETDTEDPPAAFSSLASARLESPAIGSIIFIAACTFILAI
ncbi:hypothetical protein BGX26_000259, partial [Mortierella sp. AD094]